MNKKTIVFGVLVAAAILAAADGVITTQNGDLILDPAGGDIRIAVGDALTTSGDLVVNANGGDMTVQDDSGQMAFYIKSGKNTPAVLRLGDRSVSAYWHILNNGNGDKELMITNKDEKPVFVIKQSGSITVGDLKGSGSAYACIDKNGRLYRSNNPCR